MHSFDIFDTSLVRVFPRSDDLFRLAAKNVLEKQGIEARKEDIFELARTRIEAALSGRQNSEREDVPLQEIYSRMDLEPWGITASDLMSEELRLQTESVRPVARTRTEIADLRRAGERIVFLSDTSIPSGLLKEMLESAGMGESHDAVYTSGDIGLTKASGRLFDHVLTKEAIRAKDWIHHGDDQHSDVEVARRVGIQVAPFPEASLDRFESMLLEQSEGEPWVGSLLAGVSRLARLTTQTDDGDFMMLRDIGSGVIAPLLTSFVSWVVQEAREAGVERLYFVSRDGDVLLHIVRELEKEMQVPDCRYLYGSRQGWLLPSITSLDREELHWVLDESPRLADLLAKLSLKPTEVSHLLEDHGFDESHLQTWLDAEDQERFWALIEHPDVASLVLDRAERARETTVAYLEQEGLTTPGRWALVDVGWKLRSQWALKRILETIDHGEAVNGYYLAVSERRRSVSETGPYRALFFPEESEMVRGLLSHAMVLEEAFLSADHGSVVGYRWKEDCVAPVLSEWPPDERRSRYLSHIRQVMATYAREALAAGILQKHLELLCRAALRVTNEFLTNPTRAEARTVAWLSASDDLTHGRARTRALAVPVGGSDVVKQLAMGNLGRLEAIRRIRGAPGRYFWEEGSLALSAPWLRTLFRLASRLRLRVVLEAPAQLVRGARKIRLR